MWGSTKNLGQIGLTVLDTNRQTNKQRIYLDAGSPMPKHLLS